MTQPSSEKGSAQPRCCHYAFAHVVMPTAAFQDPLNCLIVLASPNARPFLSHLLEITSKHCKARELQSDFGADDLIIHQTRVGPYPCAIVEMPAPKATTEAYFVAMVLLNQEQKDEIPETGQLKLRYFTLEKGAPGREAPGTVIGGWSADGTHFNYGSGPAPELSLFVQALADKLITKAKSFS